MVAAITLTPDNGVVGATITIDGTGFTATEDITLTYGGSPLTPVAPISTDGAGAFSGSFIVPASVFGVHSVVATDETLLTDDADFTVAANLVITESNVIVGGTINFVGTGFSNAEAISFTFDGDAAVPVEDPITSSATGGFTGSFVIPATPNGSRTLVATDVSTENDSDTVIVDAKITLDVSAGDYGDSVTVTGTGFDAASATTITFNSVDVTGAALNTDADGGFSRVVTVPDAPFGAQTVTATDAGAKTDSDTFTVAALITLDDGSGSIGETVVISGHGFAASSAVTFTFDGDAIVPTDAPITSAADGSFSADIVVPTGSDDTVTIVAIDAATRTDSITFIIITASATEILAVSAFSHLNGRNLSLGSVNELGTREKGLFLDVPFGASDVYTTGGVLVDFSGYLDIVYICKVIHNTVGLECSFIPGASDSASLGKIKFWGTDGNELADNSSAITSKTLRVFIRGR